MDEQTRTRLCAKIDDAKRFHTDNELAKGFVMYEYLRTLNARQFAELCARNLAGENFDDMVIHAAANRQ